MGEYLNLLLTLFEISKNIFNLFILHLYIIDTFIVLIAVKLKSRGELLNDMIADADNYPNNWKAIFGNDNERLSRDFYIFNPDVGIYLLKEYNKNPFEVKGIGGKIARSVDEDIQLDISQFTGDFGILQGDIRKIADNIKKGISPEKIINTAISGKRKNYGISLAMKGHSSASTDKFTKIRETLSNKQKSIDTKLEKMANSDGIYSSYG